MSLFAVMLLAFLVTMFTISSASQVHTQTRNISLARAADVLRLNAISCIHIARLLFFSGNEVAEGEYNTPDGQCVVENVVLHPGSVTLHARSTGSGAEYLLESRLDRETFDILYIRNMPDK